VNKHFGRDLYEGQVVSVKSIERIYQGRYAPPVRVKTASNQINRII
jgi:hypothetical protein